MPALAHTSVPPWAVGEPVAAPQDVGSPSYLLVGVGAAGKLVARMWAVELAGCPEVRLLEVDDLASGESALAQAVATSRVGVRVRLAAPVGDALVLRGLAVRLGVEDDELYVAPTSAGGIDVFCVHCGTVGRVEADIADVVPCAGCARHLVIYHHVSRRTGHFLGYMVDAENPTGQVAG